MPDLLVEIGVEEIPAPVVLPALEQLRQAVDEGLTARRLEHGPVRVFGTPRRLAVLVTDVAACQPDEVKEVKGPPAAAAFDADGKPTPAALGFAASRGVAMDQLRVVETDKGSFVFATVAERGQPASVVIPALLTDVLNDLSFPKTMRWGDVDTRFCRPVRWLVALLDEEVLEWTYAGLKAGRTTRGHRFLGPGSGDIARPSAYVETLRDLFVIVDHEERENLIAAKAREVAATVNARPRLDPDLLTENNFLVEYPTCVLGSFPERYLALPERVPVTVMEKHQRYFAVEDEHGALLPYFVIVRNGSEAGSDIVRRGNEKVIVPRLEDAEFYLTEDLKTPLPERLETLRRVTYMESLGSLYDKTKRLEAWVSWLNERLPGLSEDERQAALRAAMLSKCDQVTLMVGDGKLAALQGYIGGHYARCAGEPEAVAVALAEQYLPVRQDDPLPATAAGRLLAVADRFDNLCAAFTLGLVPRGTRDPQGLRRQTQGLIAILLEAGYRLDLLSALSFGLAQIPRPDPAPKGALEPTEARDALWEFIASRLQAILEDEGLSYDTVRSALGSHWTDVVDVIERARALGFLRRSAADFEAQVDTATRPANIWRGTDLPAETVVDPALFADPTEQSLWTVWGVARERIAALKQTAPVDYRAVWETLSQLQQPIAALFDAVMVNAEDMNLRRNRLAMMRELDRLYLELADFREIVQ